MNYTVPLSAHLPIRWQTRLLAVGVIVVLVACLLLVAAGIHWFVTPARAQGSLPSEREDCHQLFVPIKLDIPELAAWKAWAPIYLCPRDAA
jgi:hypothetical protein